MCVSAPAACFLPPKSEPDPYTSSISLPDAEQLGRLTCCMEADPCFTPNLAPSCPFTLAWPISWRAYSPASTWISACMGAWEATHVRSSAHGKSVAQRKAAAQGRAVAQHNMLLLLFLSPLSLPTSTNYLHYLFLTDYVVFTAALRPETKTEMQCTHPAAHAICDANAAHGVRNEEPVLSTLIHFLRVREHICTRHKQQLSTGPAERCSTGEL